MRSLIPWTAAALSLFVTWTPAARAGDLGRVLPGTLHGGFLADAALLLQDFPGIAHEGWLGETLDSWVARGYPDPRALAGQVGIGLNVDVPGRRVRDLVVLGQGPLRIAHRVLELARRANLPVQEIPYRGVVFVRPLFEALPLWVGEVQEGVSSFHYDATGRFTASRQLVDTLRGQLPSFGDTHGMSLTPETYLVAGVSVPVANQAARLREVQTAGLHLVVHASVDWRRSGSTVKLGIELETFTPVEAGLLATWLEGRVAWLRQRTTQPVLRALLEAVVVRRLGKHVFLELDKDFELVQQGLLALNREVALPTLP